MFAFPRQLRGKGFQQVRTFQAGPLPTFHQNQILDKFLREGEKKLTLKQLLEFGRKMSQVKLLTSANYVRKELPVRLAHRISDFHHLPYIVGTNKHVEKTYALYWQAFDALRKIPEIKTVDENEQYCQTLRNLLTHHSLVIPSLVYGLSQTKQHFEDPSKADEFFQRMLRSRMSRRLLAEQHLRLSNSSHANQSTHYHHPDHGFVGILSPTISTKAVLDRCYAAARSNCLHNYGVCPGMEYDGKLDSTFAGVPYHAEYTFYELLKNSMRAVVEHHGFTPFDPPGHSHLPAEASKKLPPISITIAESEKHVNVRISDQGNGLEHEKMSQIWDFSFTTAARPKNDDFFTPQMGATLEEQSISWPMAGSGYGLPISRVFSEFLGGSLELHSIHGHGMDAYVLLKKRVEDQMDHVI